MKTRLLVMATLPMAWTLSSCGLVKVPFKVAGAVVEGTAKVGKKAYDKSADALTKSDEEKAEEAKEKKAKEAEEKAAQKKKDAATPLVEGVPPAPAPAEEPLPSDDYLPPLPDDAPVPYQGQ